MKWILIIILFSFVFILAIHPLTTITYDLGLHLVFGKKILETQTVPKTNLVSYTAPEFQVVNHHWLGEVFIYLGSLFLGLKGLIVAEAVIITAAFAFAFLSFFRKETLFLSTGIGVMAVFIMMGRMDVRPEIFSFLFLGWYLFVLFKKPSSWWLWSLPVIQFLWVNTHIYFFLGPAIYAFFLLQGFIDNPKFNVKNKKFLNIGLFMVAANLINPFGVTGALYPFRIFNNYGLVISENISPFSLLNFMSLPLFTFNLGMFFVAITFIANHKNIKRNIFGLSLFVTSSILAATMFRNMPIFAFCMLPISMKNIYEARWFIRYSWQRAVFLVVIFVFLLISVVNNNFYSKTRIKRSFGLGIPTEGQEAVNFVKRTQLKGPIFNSYNVGNFLIWQLPNEKIFIDGRPEAYPADFIKSVYIGMQIDPKLFEKYSEQYKFNYIFWDKADKSILAQRFIESLKQNSKWLLVYENNKFFIFLRNMPENQKLID